MWFVRCEPHRQHLAQASCNESTLSTLAQQPGQFIKGIDNKTVTK